VNCDAAVLGRCPPKFAHPLVIKVAIGARLWIYAVSPVCGKLKLLSLIEQLVSLTPRH
jgi:hypothetical protein